MYSKRKARNGSCKTTNDCRKVSSNRPNPSASGRLLASITRMAWRMRCFNVLWIQDSDAQDVNHNHLIKRKNKEPPKSAPGAEDNKQRPVDVLLFRSRIFAPPRAQGVGGHQVEKPKSAKWPDYDHFGNAISPNWPHVELESSIFGPITYRPRKCLHQLPHVLLHPTDPPTLLSPPPGSRPLVDWPPWA